MNHEYNQVMFLANTLKGAPLTVLFVMLLIRRPLGVKELSILTGYHRNSVSAGLETLQKLQLVSQTQRYFGWQLTNLGYQLPLHGLNALSQPDSTEAEKNSLPSRSSSFKTDVLSANIDSIQLPLLPGEAEKNSLPPTPADHPHLVSLLTDRCGTPPKNAQKAIAQALARASPALIHVEILRWLAYCLSSYGQSINNPGIFIASRIADGIKAPAWFNLPPGSDIAEEIRQLQPPPCFYCGQPARGTLFGEPICEECRP